MVNTEHVHMQPYVCLTLEEELDIEEWPTQYSKFVSDCDDVFKLATNPSGFFFFKYSIICFVFFQASSPFIHNITQNRSLSTQVETQCQGYINTVPESEKWAKSLRQFVAHRVLQDAYSYIPPAQPEPDYRHVSIGSCKPFQLFRPLLATCETAAWLHLSTGPTGGVWVELRCDNWHPSTDTMHRNCHPEHHYTTENDHK